MFSASIEKRIGNPELAKLAVNGANISLVTYADGRPMPGLAGVIAPGLFLVLFYLAVLMLGNQMLNVTLEEKENRVTEMILTTMNPTTLIVGKVLALVLIGIVQESRSVCRPVSCSACSADPSASRTAGPNRRRCWG